jgi:fucose 4-O-acetylase-like acetyltransferase
MTIEGKMNSKILTATKVSANSRMAYIDVVRFVLIAMVIMVHAAVTYGSAGSWTYVDAKSTNEMTSALLTFFVMYSQSFFMSLFFFFAGYFTPGSYDKKGAVRFWKDRIVHLGIPMVLYTFILSRIPNYMDDVVSNGETASFWQYSARTFISDADEGPSWFLFALLAFTIVYTVWRLIGRSIKNQDRVPAKPIAAPNNLKLIVVAFVMAAAMFAIGQILPIVEPVDIFGVFSLLMGFFPFYIIIFIGGILAYRNNWLAEMPAEMLRFWKWFSLGLIVFLPVFIIATGALEIGIDPYMSGMNWRCAIMSLWFGLACVSFCTTLTLWAREKIQKGNGLTSFLSANTFTVYLIHPIVLVAFTVAIRNIGIHPLFKFTLASVFTVVVCYILAEIIRRIPIVKEML